MSTSRFNNSSVFGRITRSRSNSVSSIASLEEVAQPTFETTNILNSNTPAATDITSALVNSFQIAGATSTWDNIKKDVKSLSLQFEARITTIEAKIDKILEKLEASPSQVVQAHPTTTLLQDNSFAPGGSRQNELSVRFFLQKKKIIFYFVSLTS